MYCNVCIKNHCNADAEFVIGSNVGSCEIHLGRQIAELLESNNRVDVMTALDYERRQVDKSYLRVPLR